MQDHHPIAEFPANLAYRLRQVGIVGDNQRRIKGFVEGVDQQPGRQVDIRSLLFNLEHLHQRRRRGRCRERMPRQLHRFPRIRALMEMQAGQRPQCPEVGTLPDMLIGIVGIGPDPGGEIMNILDLASGKRQLAEGTQVQPLIWGIHQAAVISIESVDVDVQDHAAWTVKSKGRPSGRPCYPTTEVVRGIYHQHVARKALRSNLFPEPPTEGATHFLAPHLRRPVRVTALRCLCLRTGSGIPAARPHPRVVPPPRTTWAKWAICISFVPQSKWPLPRSLRASEPVDPRERDGRMEKCQNKAGCSGFCCCQIRTYDERAGSPTRALMAAETSGTST